MNGIIGGPLPSRRVLDELDLLRPGHPATPTALAFMDLGRALAAHALALLAVDRAEAALIAARASADVADPGRGRGRARVVDDDDGSAPRRRSAEPNAGPGRGHGVGSKRRAFMVRHARQLRLDRRARDFAARLLSMPAAGPGDIAFKLAVVIAASEAGPPEAAAFPWAHLRQILAELLAIATAGA